ncbi:DUF3833 domain-containing protein [Jiella sp. MQZ9-1]|uniref:DUF3833 family protein n=1 Tax=Jiella flava TaxID=2816857 RepID=A0A939JXD2_9HYPH|nr:DUF3833 family protein [Jiella flava]MBO0663246.1 DUF3833 family protein [Jiella flava]MCD2471822.1 DUF3833 domain-containing protein [Jiella flava]
MGREIRRHAHLAVVLLFSAVVVLAGCVGAEAAGTGVTPGGKQPRFSLLTFFDGDATSRGMITTALVFSEAFTARFAGKVSGNRLRLDERFRFKDGMRLQRWDLQRLADGTYRGTVRTELSDGTMAPPAAVKGRSFAGGVVLAYDGYAPGGGHTRLGFRHVMRPVSRETVENHVTIFKFGLPIAKAEVIFRRAGGKPKR